MTIKKRLVALESRSIDHAPNYRLANVTLTDDPLLIGTHVATSSNVVFYAESFEAAQQLIDEYSAAGNNLITISGAANE